MNRRTLHILGAALVIFLSLFHLSDYPTTWFDEGSHLHVPKALLAFGAYADYSSDGLRYFGPTLGVGPTVILPVTAAFKMLGIGLLQARLVIVLYLLGALYFFYRLARNLGGEAVGALALALLVSSRAIAIFETGRQVLGEVPALFFLLAAFLVWFSAWEGQRGRLVIAGVLFGAAAITKYQMLLAIAPAFAIGFVLNYLYYKGTLARVFVWPAILTAAVFGLWQLVLVVYLGPQNSLANLAALRAATAGAATVFSPQLMKRAVEELTAFKTFGGALAIALLYGVFVSLPRSRRGQQWGALLSFALVNLAWYVFASISWLRYAFAGLAIASLFLAKFFIDLVELLRTRPTSRVTVGTQGNEYIRTGLVTVVGMWAAMIVLPGLLVTVLPIVRPPVNAPAAMASYLSREVPRDAVIETWEPELGFLTAHNYHYPPTGTLNVAVRHIWSGGPAPRLQYHPLEVEQPPYVVVGSFGRWVDVYPSEVLNRDYHRLTSIGEYELYARKVSLAAVRGEP
jgi:hypothetical protein